MRCSRFDLFQTGITSAPRSAAIRQARKLRLGLVREAVADAERELLSDFEHEEPQL